MFSFKTYKVVQTNKSNSYTLYLQYKYGYGNDNNNNNNKKLYESITKTKILTNAFLSEAENEVESDSSDSIIFTAESVNPLSIFLKKGKLSIQKTVKMIHDLSKQISYLENNLLAFYGYDLDDILVINEDIFFIVNTKSMTKIESKDKCIYFYNPITIPYFSNPELNKLTKLPAKIDYRSSYYSLGALILFCSTNVYIFAEIHNDLTKILSPIYYTKIYWFLMRCFHENCKQRILLFI